MEYKIFSNIDLFLPPTIRPDFVKITSVQQIDEIHNGVFLFDEMWKWVDARVSGSKRNRFFSAWSIITRKRHIDLLYTEQYERLIDVRIRAITDYLAKPHQRGINVELTLQSKYKQIVYNYTVVGVVSLHDDSILPTVYVLTNRLYFELYDTFEEPADLEGDGYLDEAREIATKLTEDDYYNTYLCAGEQKNKVERLEHIKKQYNIDRATANAAYRFYHTDE